MRAPATVVESGIHPRLVMSATWIATMFVFAYVDLFSLYRADVRARLEEGTVGGFDVNQVFLLATVLYVVVPSVMVYLTLVVPRRIIRPVSVGLAVVYALTIVGGAVGEWGYYVVGSAVEVGLLVALAVHALAWKDDQAAPASPSAG